MFISKSIATTAKEHIRNENCVRFTTVQNTYVETSGCNASATDSTYSCWVKSNSGTSGQGYLFGHNNSFFKVPNMIFGYQFPILFFFMWKYL